MTNKIKQDERLTVNEWKKLKLVLEKNEMERQQPKKSGQLE